MKIITNPSYNKKVGRAGDKIQDQKIKIGHENYNQPKL
jgi:hypothetical protein